PHTATALLSTLSLHDALPICRPLDQTGDLDELKKHTANSRERGDRTCRRERVVAGLDLDIRQRLQQRRLARIGRPDERDLRSARSEEHTSELQSRFDLVCRLP